MAASGDNADCINRTDLAELDLEYILRAERKQSGSGAEGRFPNRSGKFWKLSH